MSRHTTSATRGFRAGRLLALAAALALVPLASANTGIRNAWQAQYPSSQSYQASSCSLCHASNSATSRYNSYGFAIKQLLDAGSSNTAAFLATESFDSDLDPTGTSNLYEILHGTQPGWTAGANNTTYTGGGTPTSGVTPPTTITGSFDPFIGTNYCSPGVPNSTGVAGAIRAWGSTVVANNDVTLRATSLPLNAFGFFLASRTQGSVNQPGGSQGVLCLGGAIGRYVGPGQIRNSGTSGSFALVLDLTRTPQPSGLVAVTAGETWNFQAWYRDSVGGNASSNLTNGLALQFN